MAQSLSANMLNAIARLIYVYGDDLNDERFKEKLSKISAKEISRIARDRRKIKRLFRIYSVGKAVFG